MDMLTHELRSALSVIKVSGSSLSHYLAGQAPEVNQRLTSIQQAAGSMSRIVERCIQLDQLDQSAQPIRRVACTADDIIDEVADTHDAQRNRLDIRDSASETLMADPDLLRVMLDNLVDNALKYATPGTTVTIAVATETRNKRPAVRFTVENQVAPGTAPPTGEMFVRYFRGAHSHEFSGTGLGLCLVRELARLQGGDADYQGTPSGQVRISFWLPSEMTTNPST
jgi:signal transduction histidine kinase